MNRDVSIRVILVMLALVLVSSLYTSYRATKATEAMQMAQASFERAEAVRLVGDIISDHRYYGVQKALCGENGTAMCSAVTFASGNQGNHNPMWIGLDAAYVLGRASNLTDEQRQELARKTLNVVVALADYKAWQVAQVGKAEAGRVYAVELYVPLMAEAMACQRMPVVMDCHKGLRPPVADALRELMAYVAEHSSDVLGVYETNLRKDGVDALLTAL